jgi:hypothetical protein
MVRYWPEIVALDIIFFIQSVVGKLLLKSNCVTLLPLLSKEPSYFKSDTHFPCNGSVTGTCARRDDDVHQRMNANGLSPYDLFS